MGTYIIDGTAREAIAEPVKRCTVSELRDELLGEKKEKEAKEAETKARAEAKKAEKEAQGKETAAA
jgi:hypothetical protein